MAMPARARKVLLLEFNEITWTLVDPLIARGRLPNLARLRREGSWGAPVALEQPPHLDPWITWVTLHTGVGREVHGATVLEQETGSIAAPRSWEYVAAAGKSVGVFGSIGAYPPRPVDGFMVPGPFAPGSETFPESLRPVQELNRRYTQLHNRVGRAPGPLDMARELAGLVRLGLRPSTIAAIGRQLAAERLAPHLAWRRAALQPRINFDLFARLYRRHRPDFATWHTNHAAHYMHHHWRAMDDRAFPGGSSPSEKLKYGDAVVHGYEVCDRLLGKFLRLCDRDTVVVLASSMGQQPFVSDLYPEGKVAVRFRDVRRVLDIVGARGATDIVPMMLPQYNVRIRDAAERARVRDLLRAARCQGAVHAQAIGVEEAGELLTLTPRGLARHPQTDVEAEVGIRYFFPGAPGARAEGHALDELFVCDVPTAKQGMHHPRGLVVFYGAGVRRQALDQVSPLDLAPTMLSLLGVPVPAIMKGRVLSELFDGDSARPERDQGSPHAKRVA
jgi:hypothetical protein